jgi:Disulphide bond corrector protein DsbC
MFYRWILVFSLNAIWAVPDKAPIKWTYFSKRIAGEEFEVHMVAAISKGWHIYSVTNTSGPGPTHFKFFMHSGLKLLGEVKEGIKPNLMKDAYFKMPVRAYAQQAEFTQKIERKDSVANEIKGLVYYIACNEKDCLPPKTDSFRVAIQ